MSFDEFIHDRTPYHPIAIEPWKTKFFECSAGFRIAHFGDRLFIKYKVKEPFLSVKKRRVNELVNKDNCVEFFLAFENDHGYYNFEINCLGSIKAAFGNNRKHRRFLPASVLNSIEDNITLSINNLNTDKFISWELCLTLNASDFCFHQQASFSGLSGKVNFTKCGDNLPNPHYLTWANIIAEKPDFHQPGFFGEIVFENIPLTKPAHV
jgi:hypothetical protein